MLIRNMRMWIFVREQWGESICAGAQAGREFLGKLLSLTATEPARPEPLFLDFTGIDHATASFLRESALALRTLLSARASMLYPVVTNANNKIEEELDIVLSLRGEAYITCRADLVDPPSQIKIIGKLEKKQHRILDFILNKGETDAGELQ